MIDTAPISGLPGPLRSMTSPLLGGVDFAGILRNLTGAQERAVVREAAAQLVSSTFIAPMLKEMREGSFLAGPFAPDFAQQQFQPLLDQQIADQVASGARLPLAEVIVNRLLGPERTNQPMEVRHGS